MIDTTKLDRRTAANKGFAIAGVPCFADSFAVAESSVPPLRSICNAAV